MADTQFGKNGWTPERIGSLKGKTFLITGATSGIGFEAAKILASKDARVVMLNRNPQKSEDCIAAIKNELGGKAVGSLGTSYRNQLGPINYGR